MPPGGMPMRSTNVCLAGCVVLFAAGAQGQAPTGQIQGSVRGETGVPLEGVSVVAGGAHLGAGAPPDGHYLIVRGAPGAYPLRPTRDGVTSRGEPIPGVAGD